MRLNLEFLSKICPTIGKFKRSHCAVMVEELQFALHYTTLHCTALHCTALYCTALYCTALHYTTLHYTTLHYLTTNFTTLHYAAPNSSTVCHIILHNISLHFTIHFRALHVACKHITYLPTFTPRPIPFPPINNISQDVRQSSELIFGVKEFFLGLNSQYIILPHTHLIFPSRNFLYTLQVLYINRRKVEKNIGS